MEISPPAASDSLFLPIRYGFGETGKAKYGIQANAELVYEVTLKSFEKVRAGARGSLPRSRSAGPFAVSTLCPWRGAAWPLLKWIRHQGS